MINVLPGLQHVLDHPLNRHKYIDTLGRIVAWKINQLLYNLDRLVPITAISKINVPPESSYGSLIYYCRGYVDPIERLLIEKTISKGEVFIDIGANIGYYSLVAANNGATVYAFEPNKKLHETIKKTFLLNALLSKLRLYSAVVSDRSGFENFAISNTSELSHIASKGESCERIISTTLDTFISKNKIQHISFLKIDVEGAEPKVFLGMVNTFKSKKISYLLFEHDPFNLTNTQYIQQIRWFLQNAKVFIIVNYKLVTYKDKYLTEKINIFVKF